MIIADEFYKSPERPRTDRRQRPVAFLGCVRVPNEDGFRMGLLPPSRLREPNRGLALGNVIPASRRKTTKDPTFSVEALKGGRPFCFFDRDTAFEAARQLRLHGDLDPTYGSVTLTPREDRVMVTWRRDGILYHAETVHRAPRVTLLRLTNKRTWEFMSGGFSTLLRVFSTKEEASDWVSARALLSQD